MAQIESFCYFGCFFTLLLVCRHRLQRRVQNKKEVCVARLGLGAMSRLITCEAKVLLSHVVWTGVLQSLGSGLTAVRSGPLRALLTRDFRLV